MASRATSTEVERKFDVDDATVPPSLEGITADVRAQPTRSLDADYFDTRAGDLAARGITLRRRTGGTDAGWHLKLPAGPDARTEVRLPLDASATPPRELVDVVAAVVRDRPLAPVARIATTRAVLTLHDPDGGVLAEFCDDRVAAWTLGPSPVDRRWREWEVELVDAGDAGADRELLEQLSIRLLAAGASTARHGSKLARLLPGAPVVAPPTDRLHRAITEQVDALLVWDRAVRADAPDAVHQMRVTTRKIRSLLRADGFDADPNHAPVLDELRQLAAVLGVARDAEVLAERYRAELAALPPTLVRGPIGERLVGGAERRYRSGWRRAVAAMRSPRYFRLLDDLDELVRHAAPPAGSASTTINDAYRRVRKAAAAAAGAAAQDRDEALHRIRKAAKRLRYTATAADATEVAGRAEIIQTLLGDHQDSVVSRKHLQQQADAGHAAGEDTFTYGLLYQREEDLARACRAQLDAALDQLAKAVRRAER